MGVFEILLFHLFLGLISSFSPCLFPLLPSFVALTSRQNNSRKVIFLSAVFLTLGLLIVFFLIGLLFSTSSKFIGEFLLVNYATFAKIQATLLVVAGTLMIWTPSILTRITMPSRLDMFTQSIFERENPYLSSFVIGSVYTIIAAPCASGIFVLVWSEMLTESLMTQFIIVLFFAIGGGLPFFLMSLYVPSFNSMFMKSVTNARRKITITLGIILIFVGIWLFSSSSPNVLINFE